MLLMKLLVIIKTKGRYVVYINFIRKEIDNLPFKIIVPIDKLNKMS